MKPIKSRVKEHRRVRAGDLVPHELNPRIHSETQRKALNALYEEIGFARSVLAYETVIDGEVKLKLIDGHLRQSMDPDMELDVEVLDVSDAEARKLLLSIDPLAQLANFDDEVLAQLRSVTESDNEVLNELWASLAQRDEQTIKQIKVPTEKVETDPIPEQFIVLIECSNEEEQIKLLRQFKKNGLKCRALTS